jgi:hypothetical protein
MHLFVKITRYCYCLPHCCWYQWRAFKMAPCKERAWNLCAHRCGPQLFYLVNKISWGRWAYRYPMWSTKSKFWSWFFPTFSVAYQYNMLCLHFPFRSIYKALYVAADSWQLLPVSYRHLYRATRSFFLLSDNPCTGFELSRVADMRNAYITVR